MNSFLSQADICIRLAQPSVRDQLLRFREALWPTTSAEEHARELMLVLEGKAPVTMPLIILVAEASERILAGFLEADLRSHADAATRRNRCAISMVGTLLRTIDTGGSAENFWLRQKTGHAGRGCVEMASDTWVDNEVSQRVHAALGYEVVDRCVHYRKTL
jgi:aminoglycoside 6'-N-acetyltransferase I